MLIGFGTATLGPEVYPPRHDHQRQNGGGRRGDRPGGSVQAVPRPRAAAVSAGFPEPSSDAADGRASFIGLGATGFTKRLRAIGLLSLTALALYRALAGMAHVLTAAHLCSVKLRVAGAAAGLASREPTIPGFSRRAERH